MSIWDKRIDKALKFREDAVTHGRKVYARYEDERSVSTATGKKVNYFYANVNTQKESLYNSMPKPDVSRIHKGDYDNDVARVAAIIVSRCLEYEVICAIDFNEAIKSAILDRLVPGIGQVWVRFESNEDLWGDPVPKSEKLFIDTVYWEDFLYEPARSWTGVGWVGRRLSLTKREIAEKFGDQAFDQINAVKNDDELTPAELTKGKYEVWEIWDKRKREVVYVSKGLEEPLAAIPDPYKLKNFYPCPPPLIANVTTTKFLPVTDYHIAQDQYNQLDTIYARIQLILEAVKVAGGYDASTPELGRILNTAENTLIPVDNWAMYAEKGGAKGMIDWYPVDQVVAVLQQLQAQFEVSKQILYEITGMSDIVRGASNQYETASAQQIKAQFASVRLNGAQKQVAEFVRDIMRIMAELMVQLYSDDKIFAVIGQLNAPDRQFIVPAMQVLRDDLLSSYNVDIEANSLTQADWSLERQQRMDIVTTLGQMLQTAGQMVQQVPDVLPLLVQMIKFAIAGFKGASELEGWLDQQLDQMLMAQQQAKQNPQPKQPSPEEIKAQGQMQKIQGEMALKKQEAEQEATLRQQDAVLDQQSKEQELMFQRQMHIMDMRIKELELQYKQQEHAMDLRTEAIQGQIKVQHQERMADIKEKSNGNGQDTH